MASLEKVSRQYRGKMASGYDEKRLKQRRWHEEDRIVGEMLRNVADLQTAGRLLDCPVGTGRFLPLYNKMSINGVGIDSSEEMLALARKKLGRKQRDHFHLMRGSAAAIPDDIGVFTTCVAVRFFNLLEPEALRRCFAEMSRVTSTHMICTVRLGPEYYSNSAMATHDERAWWRMVKKHGWELVRDETEPFVKGWHLMLLRRK